MSANETKERILDAAERLFAEEGFDATSLRAVTAAAGTNLAAVNYHFGSKAALLPAVVSRILEPVNARQLELLEALEAAETTASVEQLVEAFVLPIVDLFDEEGDRGPMVGRLFARIMGDPGADMQRMVLEQVQESDGRYQAAFGRVLLHLPPEEVWWRFRTTAAIAGSMAPVVVSRHVHVETMLALLGAPPAMAGTGRDARLGWMLTFLSGALRAPATGAASRAERQPARALAEAELDEQRLDRRADDRVSVEAFER